LLRRGGRCEGSWHEHESKKGPQGWATEESAGRAHRLQATPRIQRAIELIVQEDKSRDEAAKLVGLTDNALYKSMKRNSASRAYYANEIRALMTFAKAKAVRTLINELDGPNAAARVAAARIILEDSERSPAASNMPQVPGFAILIADARAVPQALPVGPVINQIAHQPIQEDGQQ
jgi:hypothetical protein